MDWLTKVPAIGGLFKGGGALSTEFTVVVGGASTILAIPDCPGWAKALGIGLLGAGYAISRAMTKGAIANA